MWAISVVVQQKVHTMRIADTSSDNISIKMSSTKLDIVFSSLAIVVVAMYVEVADCGIDKGKSGMHPTEKLERIIYTR